MKFRAYDILQDLRLKEWLKFYANWPNFPMTFIGSKFIGGIDIVVDMIENDEFLNLVPTECIKTNTLERIKNALNRSVVVLFMKGSEAIPKDNYQKEAVEILRNQQVRFTSYDVFRDPVNLLFPSVYHYFPFDRTLEKSLRNTPNGTHTLRFL